MDSVSEKALKQALAADPAAGWRAFVESYTPTLLAILERLGFTDYDEAMEIYVIVCERLMANGCERLRSHDSEQGSLRAWLARVVRNAAVDWIRARAGRRRLFKNVATMKPLDQTCFELFFWEGLRPGEIAETLSVRHGRPVSLLEVLDSLDRLHDALSERQRGELFALSARNQRPASLDDVEGKPDGAARREPADGRPNAELAAIGREQTELLDEALSALPSGDAAILRLKYVQGLSVSQIERALHLERLTHRRVKEIERHLRAKIERTLGKPAFDSPSDSGALGR